LSPIYWGYLTFRKGEEPFCLFGLFTTRTNIMKFLTHKGVPLAGHAEVEKFDWRASTRQVRNEQYSAAIWFRQRRQEQLASGFWGWFNFQAAPAQNLKIVVIFQSKVLSPLYM
jgi:hypothetical protein